MPVRANKSYLPTKATPLKDQLKSLEPVEPVQTCSKWDSNTMYQPVKPSIRIKSRVK